MRGACLAAASAALGACTLLYGPSDAEFTNGSVAARPDGSSSSSSAAGGVGPDGAAGAATEAGASTSSTSSSGNVPLVCPAAALACADFEDGTPPPAFTPSGPIVVVAGGRASGHALEATAGNNNNGYDKATFDNTSKVTLSFWFRAPKAPDDPTVHFRIAALLYGAACDWPLAWQVWLSLDGLHEGTDSYDQAKLSTCGPVKYDSKAVLTAAEAYDGNWHHIVAVTDASATVRTTTVTADDHPAVTDAADSGRVIVPTTVELDLGIPCVQQNAGCFPWQGTPFSVDIDQVTVTSP